MASGAGLNRVGFRGGKIILTCTKDGTYDSGIVMSEAMAFSKWLFQLRVEGSGSGTVSGWSVTLYGTIDPTAFDLYEQYFEGQWKAITPVISPLTLLPATSWVGIPAPSTEDASPDAYAWANPLTATGLALYSPAPWIAVRAVAVGSSSTGAIDVLAFAIP